MAHIAVVNLEFLVYRNGVIHGLRFTGWPQSLSQPSQALLDSVGVIVNRPNLSFVSPI